MWNDWAFPAGIRQGLRVAACGLCLSSPATVLAQSSPAAFTAQGRIEAAGGTMAIGSAASGTVKDVMVVAGGRVKAGQVIVQLNCQPLEAEIEARRAQFDASQAVFDRVRHGPRADEIKVAEAAVGYSNARAEEAQKTYQRTQQLHEGVTVTTARILETQRDSRIAAAQLAEARAKLDLLRAGSREEDVREAQSRRDSAAADLENARARLAQCSIRAPVDGVIVDVLANPGEFLSLAVPTTLIRMVADRAQSVNAEIELRDAAHVCLDQEATVTTETSNLSVHARVVGIVPAVHTRTFAAQGAQPKSNDVQTVILNVDPGAVSLPIGWPVAVHFSVCPSKS
jgi:multidrug resistance efflux pump